jgi:hypothetical protein
MVLFVALVALLLTLFTVMSLQNWQLSFDDGITSQRGVRLTGAELRAPDKLGINLDVCKEVPEVVQVEESLFDVQIKVVADSFPFRDRSDCGTIVEVQLQQPLGDRILIDKETGDLVNVRRGVRVLGVELIAPDRLDFEVNSCIENAGLSNVQESDHEIRIFIVADSERLAKYEDCTTIVDARLKQSWAGRTVVDIHTGQTVNVTKIVRVQAARISSPGKLALTIDSCQRSAEVSQILESVSEVKVKIVDSAAPFGFSRECAETIVVQLQEPLGDRVVVDIYSGGLVVVSPSESQ